MKKYIVVIGVLIVSGIIIYSLTSAISIKRINDLLEPKHSETITINVGFFDKEKKYLSDLFMEYTSEDGINKSYGLLNDNQRKMILFDIDVTEGQVSIEVVNKLGEIQYTEIFFENDQLVMKELPKGEGIINLDMKGKGQISISVQEAE